MYGGIIVSIFIRFYYSLYYVSERMRKIDVLKIYVDIYQVF